MAYKRQRGAYAVIITAAIALHLFAAGAVYLLVQREARLRSFQLPAISSVKPEGAEAFGRLRTIRVTISGAMSPDTTPLVLDVLLRHGAHAVFFPLPESAYDSEDDLDLLYGRIKKDGHTFGNNTYSHDFITIYAENDIESFRADVIKMNDYLSVFGITPAYFRFPGGTAGRPESVMAQRRSVLDELGLSEIEWDAALGNADSADKTADALASEALSEITEFIAAGRDEITLSVCCSRGQYATAAALDILLTQLTKLGYQIL